MEQAMLRYLLQGEQQPVIYALGRGIQQSTRFGYELPIESGRLLIVSPFTPEVQTVTQETADIRNLLIADLADQFFIPYITPGGNLDRLLDTELLAKKPIMTLDLPENKPLFELGAEVFEPRVLIGKFLSVAKQQDVRAEL
jgi:hypothetical protein